MVESSATSSASKLRPSVLAPHPVIAGAYASPQHKREFLSSIFDDTAQDYDRIEHWLSLGSGRWYRRQALIRAGLTQGMRVADVAIGTGLVAGEALPIIGPAGQLIGIDPSVEMMRRASERLGVKTLSGVAEALPLPDASCDFLSMGYALRHVEDLAAAFGEFHRVLTPAGQSGQPGQSEQSDQFGQFAQVRQPGQFGAGRLCILEITRPTSRLGRAMLRLYLGTCSRLIGLFGKLAPRTPELWAYYWQTIDKCVPPEQVLAALIAAGFADVKRTVVFGIFSEYTAVRR